ncbi:MAG: hypothetical protein AAFY22_01170 [Pseudomonadota bacterium]
MFWTELTRLFAIRQARLMAKLRGVAGFSGRGEIAYAAFGNGAKTVSIKATGIAGQKAALFINQQPLGDMNVVSGKIDHQFDSRRGSFIPVLQDGDAVEIHQNGEPILVGAAQSAALISR